MRASLGRCCALGLAAALSCVEAETMHEGEHVTLLIDPEVEACGDMLGHMDRFLAMTADYLGVSLAGRRFYFVWYLNERFAAKARCTRWRAGCPPDTTIWSSTAPLDRELARLLMALVGSPPPFFALGAEVVLSPVSDSNVGHYAPLDRDEVQEVLALGESGAWGYDSLAGAFTRFLIDRHGLDAYLAFYASVERMDPVPVIEAAHAEHFGESLTETSLAFAAGRHLCSASRFRLKLLECSAPPIAWDGQSLLLRRALACGDDDVVGPSFDRTAQVFSTLEIAAEGFFELSFASDEQRADATLGSCGGCDGGIETWHRPGREPVRRWLPAGRYYLNISGDAEAVTTLALRIERVDEL